MIVNPSAKARPRIYDYDVNPIIDERAVIDPDWDAYDRPQLLALLHDASFALDVDALRDMLDERDE